METTELVEAMMLVNAMRKVGDQVDTTHYSTGIMGGGMKSRDIEPIIISIGDFRYEVNNHLRLTFAEEWMEMYFRLMEHRSKQES